MVSEAVPLCSWARAWVRKAEDGRGVLSWVLCWRSATWDCRRWSDLAWAACCCAEDCSSTSALTRGSGWLLTAWVAATAPARAALIASIRFAVLPEPVMAPMDKSSAPPKS
ncbi:hypothetical protein amb0782 [Paramagnetospirillum magneticum AMB-1]|uniref:Uncharacterized protein n=1 Tax=Paramagnetospirillum magneticum (strain ATCC 700264 / AMB-1) TaxID=342108 RepID=Q2W989_PARM1|nr:hypothetical protein amb0782 [Paramagnetospirillum magneticum AMB-1]